MRKKTAILIVLISLLNFSTTYAIFLDMDNHWGDEAVYWATYDVRILNGYPDGTFRPEEYISRAQYIALLNRVLERKRIFRTSNVDISLPYVDVEKNHWSYYEIANFSKAIDLLGYTNLRLADIFPGNNLYPNKSVTRYEAALLARAITTPPVSLNYNGYRDIPRNIIHFSELNELISNGILVGYRDRFNLNDNLTRAQSATIMQRIYNDLDYLSNNYLSLGQVITVELKKYPLFIDTNNSLSSNDRAFIDAITTIEYKEFIGRIPLAEQHLYDLKPIETLWNLREGGYYNVIGLNYYILKYDEGLSYSARRKLLNEILLNLINNDELNFDEKYNIILFSIDNLRYIDDVNLLIRAAENYFNSAVDVNKQIASGVLLSMTYYNLNDLNKALGVYKDLFNLDNVQIDIKGQLILNYSYLNYLSYGKDYALNYLDDLFNSIRNDIDYSKHREDLEFMYTSFVKQLLMKP